MHFPYVSIENGKLKVDFDRKSHILFFPATEEGAKNAGKVIGRCGGCVLFSSSVDFPTEYGAPDLDFRTLMTIVDIEVNPLSLLDFIYRAMQFSIEEGLFGGLSVEQDNDNKSGTLIFDVPGIGSWILSSNDIRETDAPDSE